MDRKKMKEKFYNVLSKCQVKINSVRMVSSKYEKVLNDVKLAKTRKPKNSRDYWILRHYDALTIEGRDTLIFPVMKDGITLQYVMFEDVFDRLYEVHERIGHRGRDCMRKAMKKLYKNVTINDIQTFINLCKHCSQKRKGEKKGLIFKELNSRCRVDLIDFQSKADGEYKFILVCQDHRTKFVHLRALKSKKVEEVAKKILKIFLSFGAPSVLESDNDREIRCGILQYLKRMWPELKLVHGETQHSKSKETFERPVQAVETMITNWMLDNKTINWKRGLGFVQFAKNRAFHPGIEQSPYEAMFGHPAKVGLTTSHLPKETVESMQTTEDLEKLMVYDRETVETTEDSNSSEMISTETENLDNVQIIKIETITEIPDSVNKCTFCEREIELPKDACLLCKRKLSALLKRERDEENLPHEAKQMKYISEEHPIIEEIKIEVLEIEEEQEDRKPILD